MARTNYVKSYRGSMKCKHSPDPDAWNVKACGVSKKDHKDFDHEYDPGSKSCEKCSTKIKVGDPYKYKKLKRQYGGVIRTRCMKCPEWKPSETTTSEFLAIIYAADENAPEQPTVGDVTDGEDLVADLETFRDHYAEAAGEAAQVRIEAADNMESGFGHETSISSELREQGEHAESVQGELEDLSFDPPERDSSTDDDEWEAELESWLEEQVDAIETAWQGVQW